MTHERIGLIGLGPIGKPMARNLLKAGYRVTVFNRSQPAIDQLAHDGAIPAASLYEVAQHSDSILTALPDSPDVEDVLTRSNGVFAGAQPGLLVIDTSTIAPSTSRRLAEQVAMFGIHMLDAPISGGDVGAINATLSIMVGGDLSDLERARPILTCLGTTITHCGDHGTGQIVKACNQLVVALVIEAISEAFVLGSKAGVDPQIIA